MAKTNRKPTITFKEVLKDGIPFIEVTVTGRIKAIKKETDDVSWVVTNLTKTPLEVAVIDFYGISNLTGDPSGGGIPFANGKVPAIVIVPALPAAIPPNPPPAPVPVSTVAVNCDGDEEVIYKYSVVARVGSQLNPNPNVWFLVKDPELEMDL